MATLPETVPSPAAVAPTRVMMDTLSAYVKEEIGATVADFELLEEMNRSSAAEYGELTERARIATESMEALQEKYDEFLPQVAKINDVEKNVAELEQTVLMLDDFTKRLEEKFRKVAAQRREAARIAKAAEES